MKERGIALIASSGILYGLVTVGGSLLSKIGFSVFDISFFFLFFSVPFLAPFAIKKDPKIFSKMKTNWKYLFTYSMVNLFILFTQFGSLSLGLPPPTAALLLYTQPIWTIIFGRAFFKETITALRVGIIALALVGVFLVTNPLSLFSQTVHSSNSNTSVAEILALVGGVFLSLWIILGKKGRVEQLKEPVSLTFAVRTFSVIPIGIVSFGAYFFRAGLFLGPKVYSSDIVYLVLFAIFAGALPDYLFYRGVEKVLAIQAGVILLLEPVSSAVISVALGITILSWLQIVGGALILFSNYLVIRESSQTKEKKNEQQLKSSGDS